VHSQKFGARPDTRNRSHRSPNSDNRGPRNHQEVLEASKVSPLQVAARVANLRMLLEKAGGDIPTFSGRAEVSLEGLRQILEGQKVLGDELATHIELTLELGQGWLDKQHQIGDITQTTVDILLGKDVSTFEKDIRNSEQKGHEIMKNTASNASTPAAAAKSSNSQTTGSDKAPAEIIEARIANLTLLTQARGAKSRLARLLEVSESIVSFLFSRSKEFTNSFTRKLESTLALPELWMDTAREVSDVPHETWEKLGSSANLRGEGATKKGRKNASAKGGNESGEKSGDAVAQGNSTTAKASVKGPRGQRVHQLPKKSDATSQQGAQQSAPKGAQQGTLSLQLRTSAAPSVLMGGQDDAANPPELNVASAAGTPQASAPSQDTVNTGQAAASDQANAGTPIGSSTGVEASPAAPSAPAAAPAKAAAPKVTAAKAPAAKPEAPAPAPVAAAAPAEPAQPAAPAAQPAAAAPAVSVQATPSPAMQMVTLTPAQVSAEAAGSRPDVLELSALFLNPITEALLKTLAIKAKQGVFSEMDAYRLLGEIAEL
jgi:hypothetical protein